MNEARPAARRMLGGAAYSIAILCALGSGSIMLDIRPTAGHLESVTGSPEVAAASIVAASAAQAFVCVKVALRAWTDRVTIQVGVALLGGMLVWLTVSLMTVGPNATCGCLSIIGRQSIKSMMIVDVVALVQLLVVGWLSGAWSRDGARR